MIARISRIGRSFNGVTGELGSIAAFAAHILRVTLRPPLRLREFFDELFKIGVLSILIICVSGVAVGMVLSLQGYTTLVRFGAENSLGAVVGLSLIRELGPVLTALMVTGRVGSGIAAELGSMMVTDQISALRALGTDPIRKLVVPRVVAGTLMLPVLAVVGDAIGMVGAWLIAVTQLKQSSSVFWNAVVQGLYVQDIWMGLIKPLVLGFALASIGCYVGMRTRGGTQGVGRATTNAVVAGSVAVLALNFLVTKLLIALMY